MLTDKSIEDALDYLRDTSSEVAQAAANRVALDEGRKHLKAVIMKEHAKLPVSAQEREAYADPRYETHLKGLAEAVYEHERLRALRTAAEARIEAWRSQQANMRAQKL